MQKDRWVAFNCLDIPFSREQNSSNRVSLSDLWWYFAAS